MVTVSYTIGLRGMAKMLGCTDTEDKGGKYTVHRDDSPRKDGNDLEMVWRQCKNIQETWNESEMQNCKGIIRK